MTAIALVSLINHYYINGVNLFWDTSVCVLYVHICIVSACVCVQICISISRQCYFVKTSLNIIFPVTIHWPCLIVEVITIRVEFLPPSIYCNRLPPSPFAQQMFLCCYTLFELVKSWRGSLLSKDLQNWVVTIGWSLMLDPGHFLLWGEVLILLTRIQSAYSQSPRILDELTRVFGSIVKAWLNPQFFWGADNRRMVHW